MLRTLVPLVLAAACAAQSEAQSIARTDSTTFAGYRERLSIDARDAGTTGRIELLEDARITPVIRSTIAAAYAVGERPCVDERAEGADFCGSVADLPLRPAIVRLVGTQRNDLGHLTLERATATLARMPVSRRDTVLAVTVDLSADAGSYSGPVVRFVDVSGGRLAWTQTVDVTGATADLALVTTLKTGWHVDPTSSTPALLLVACRPDLSQPASGGGAPFVVTYSRLYKSDGEWHRLDRRVAGIWENDGEFPARSLFP
jgi:hypothetical protein